MRKVSAQLQQYKGVISLVLCLGLYCAVTRLLHIPCPILWFTGISCPGCGITRALVALCRLDFRSALYYNPSVFAVIAAVLLLIGFRKSKKVKKLIVVIAASVIVMIYIYRLAVMHTPVLQCDPANGAIPRLWRLVRSIL